MKTSDPRLQPNTLAALDAVRHGYQPIPIHANRKQPAVAQWTQLRWTVEDLVDVENRFEQWAVEDGFTNLGLMLGSPSGDLVDVDMDHPKAMRLRDLLLPPTPMRTGRPGRRLTHFWYRCAPGTLPDTRRHKMPDGSVSVELRSDRAQTLIPPSIHPSSEPYLWEGEPWGGTDGPAQVDGRVLAVQVGLLALAVVLVDNWPGRGGRHDAYLALAGGLLRYGDVVHPYWGDRGNARVLIEAVAAATHDEDGPVTRSREAIDSTIRRIRDGGKAVGFNRLAEIIGDDYVQQIRRLIAEVESTAGFKGSPLATRLTKSQFDTDDFKTELFEESTSQDLDPLSRRVAQWSRVDMEDYMTGQVQRTHPTVLQRADGQHLMYQGRVNMLYGNSESAKSWIALQTSLQEIGNGERVAYLDFEDDPAETIGRLRDLGAGIDDLRTQFAYFHPEGPHADMQRNRYGRPSSTDDGKANAAAFTADLDRLDPALIVVDGMTVLYGLHGLDTNDASSTEVITGWLKKLTRYGRTTVIVIDHTGKTATKGVYPLGSQHKVAMVQGTLLQVWVTQQPMPGALGEMELVVVKDRPGHVRRIAQKTRPGSNAQVCAVVEMDSRSGTQVAMRILSPALRAQAGRTGDAEIDLRESHAARLVSKKASQEDILRSCYRGELGKGMTIAQLTQETQWSESKVRRVADRLVERGELAVTEVPTIGRGAALKVYVLATVDLDNQGVDDDVDD